MKARSRSFSTGDVASFWSHYRPYRRPILIAGATSGAAALAELAMLAILAAVASALGDEQETFRTQLLDRRLEVSVGQMLGVAVGLVLIRAALRLTESLLAARLASRYEQERRAALVGAFLDAPWPVQAGQRSNELQDVVTGAVTYGRLGIKAMVSAIGSCASAVIMLAGAVVISWRVSLIAIVLSVLLSLGLQPLVRRSKAVGTEVRDLSLDYVAALGETVQMAREIRLANAAGSFSARLGRISRRLRARRTSEQALLGSAPSLFETGAFLIVLGGLAALHYYSLGDAGRFIAMLLLLLRASQYGRSLQGTYHQAKSSLPFLDIIDDRERLLAGAREAPGTTPVSEFTTIELGDVSYSYDAIQPVLTDVSFRIDRGDVIGVVGPSGSGKSTLVDILLGLRRPDTGTYVVDGAPHGDLDPAQWHLLTGLVTQEPQLIEGDLIDNIRFHRPFVSDADIAEAVEASGLGRDFAHLRSGLATRIGTRSTGLSGGQRQRLSIARVLAGRPQLLVLDEPTSALDVHAETVVIDALRQLKGSVTMVVVAHRLSTLRACDKVLVLRDGRVEAFADREALERDNAYFSSALDLAQMAR